MLTKDEIKRKLKEDPYWELPEDASLEEWALYDEAYDELEGDGELESDSGDDDGDSNGSWDDEE